MNVRDIKRVYFVGIGGIGMSALARYFRAMGATVAGYDRTLTTLTAQLTEEGMEIHYTDDVMLLDKEAELVVYTPAIPASHTELVWYQERNYPVFKRSDVLQWITRDSFAITVAGTHGKTTISTLIAYLLREAGDGCNAFLGGIAVNYDTNYWGGVSNVSVIEADEYDRSFLKLHPDVAVLTAIDPDHLDIYGTATEMEAAFIQYTHNIKTEGTLLVKYGLHRASDLQGPSTITYSLDNTAADIWGAEIKAQNGGYTFNILGNGWEITDVALHIGGLHNIENAIAAVAVTQMMGIDAAQVKKALAAFKGIKRRFEYVVKTEDRVYIDDYAHHPAELAALINSAKKLYPGKKCVVCFQPHLFSRTRDFADGFAQSLDLADSVLLLDIYPARELPMEGVTTAIIQQKMKLNDVRIATKDGVLAYIKSNQPELLITAGAGDIDKMVITIKEILQTK